MKNTQNKNLFLIKHLYLRFNANKKASMLYTLILSLLLVFIAIVILGFRIFFFKNKEFSSLHIGQNKHLRDKGISCATSQD